MKHCPHCSRDLLESDFHKNKGTRDGMARQCKECCRGNKVRWYRANRELAIEQSCQWIADNRERFNATARKNSTLPHNVAYQRTKMEKQRAQLSNYYVRGIAKQFRGGAQTLESTRARLRLHRSRRILNLLNFANGAGK